MIILERFNVDDFDRLIEWVESEDELIQFAGPLFKYPLTHDQLNGYLTQNKKVPYKIRLQETNKIIGHCELNFENEIPRLSRILIGEKQLRNRGIGTAVLKAMIAIVFDSDNYPAVDLSVFDWNLNAIACYKKIGFTIRPELQTSIMVSGNVWKAHNMVLLNAGYTVTA